MSSAFPAGSGSLGFTGVNLLLSLVLLVWIPVSGKHLRCDGRETQARSSPITDLALFPFLMQCGIFILSLGLRYAIRAHLWLREVRIWDVFGMWALGLCRSSGSTGHTP